jgi:hypothetical protein
MAEAEMPYILFKVDMGFYMTPIAKYKANTDHEAKGSAGFFMQDPEGIYRLYRQLEYGSVFLACWQFGEKLDEEQFLEAYHKAFPPLPLADVISDG